MKFKFLKLAIICLFLSGKSNTYEQKDKPVDHNLNKMFDRIIPYSLEEDDRKKFINKIDRLGQFTKKLIKPMLP